MLGLSSKGVNNMIEMMSYGLGEQPERLVDFEFNLGYKEKICIGNKLTCDVFVVTSKAWDEVNI